MTDIDLKKLYEKQISLTEWFDRIGYADMEAFRKEDNDKRERLKALEDMIGLPFDAPRQFPASAVAERTPAFAAFLAEHGDELCALRLIPLDPALPKLRMRGYTVRGVLAWFVEQQIDPSQYKADFVPHAEHYLWSTIFVVNEHGIFGEIIPGTHAQLTQGFHAGAGPTVFSFDFQDWKTRNIAPEARAHLVDIVGRLHVPDVRIRQRIAETLRGTFSHEYLCGYFETVASEDFGLWFIDWNRILGDAYNDLTLLFPERAVETDGVRGMVGSSGVAAGIARVVSGGDIPADINAGDILICRMTTPEYLPLMKKAAAIVTDLGGILTHAAIIARELKKPCVIGTKIATKVFKDGDMVEVDAERGIVKKLP
ncbi:MAG: hypothetical protein A3C90_00485 [Candidatus Magasanikbacteria bacterium RIFCSPHIGHO2_02_FULL_51_14]|uniref:PEP-utilising enzyme mobile domain-containing protein n=1 Tax=Candidatus Magasanikbacteria bacterium RIFCSPHIGHO2_02_FULL_51_14 TaxID=1798683 RepID=A0A1F6MHZ9_9BACT|nr:MAG: hypothetical protein A3C90_00485 [Candidatus Magasanikbacteria bacterium RIFCSPHIGHO2_02_FULL_51_14]